MLIGGSREKLERESQRALQVVGLAVPPFMALYGLTVVTGFFPSTNYAGPWFFTILMLSWVFFGVYQFVIPILSRFQMIRHIVIYHIYAVLFLLFVSGFSAPFISLITILYIASYLYLDIRGAIYSVLVMAGTIATDFLFHPPSSQTVVLVLVGYASTVIVGAAAIALNRIREFDQREVVQREALQTNRILTLVNNLADAVISVNQKGMIQIYNAAALNLFDTNTPLEGTTIDSVLHLVDENDKPIELLPLFHKAKSVTINDSLVMPTADERLRLEIVYAPIRSSFDMPAGSDLSRDGYVAIIRDITKAKSLEEERDEFISVVSHELRTPIAIAEGAIGNAQLLFERKTAERDILTSTLRTAHDQVVFLSKMVNDLSTLSRAERGVADTPEIIDVAELAHGLFNEYHNEAKKKGLQLDLELDNKLGTVKASRLYLHELIQNFITNAIKYTKEGSVTLSVRRKDHKISFAVKDTGIGISKSELDKVFLKFWRSEDYRTRETSGTGLGLYVAQKLARKLDCKIEIKSRLNHGSTFSFTLPATDKSTDR